jgi:predicted transcriptional regulator
MAKPPSNVSRNGRSNDQKLKDFEEIARRYLQGETQASIGKSLGISQQTVSDNLKEIRSRWLESSIRDFDEIKAEQLAKIDRVESECWEQWERSKKQKKTRKNEEILTGKGSIIKESETSQDQCGDPRFIAEIMKCIERRCALLGLDSELKYQDLSIAIGKVIQAGYAIENKPEQ